MQHQSLSLDLRNKEFLQLIYSSKHKQITFFVLCNEFTLVKTEIMEDLDQQLLSPSMSRYIPDYTASLPFVAPFPSLTGGFWKDLARAAFDP